MREKVIFDTNVIRNPEINNFLGGREILERFRHDADIVIPDTVIQEIKRQKRSILISNKTKFLTNPFHKLIGVDEEETKSFDVDLHIQKLLDDETIPFETIDLKNHSVLPQIKELAIFKKAPFEAGENTDKGFKDALIYFSILEYIQEIPNKYVFVYVKDGRFKDALANHPSIIIIDSYEDFKLHGISQFFDDYFIEKINEELGITILKENIKRYWHNINDNKVVLIEFGGQEIVIETDANEIINHCNRESYVQEIENLINSGNFRSTHRIINNISEFVQFFSNEEIIQILEAAYNNIEIKWIIGDSDVKQFIGNLYLSKKELVTSEEILNFFEETFN